MSKKKLIAVCMVIAFVLFLNAAVLGGESQHLAMLELHMDVQSEMSAEFQVYYGLGQDFSEKDSSRSTYSEAGTAAELVFFIPSDMTQIRVDLGNAKGRYELSNVSFCYKDGQWELPIQRLTDTLEEHQVRLVPEGEVLTAESLGEDPYFVLDVSENPLKETAVQDLANKDRMHRIGFVSILDLGVLLLFLLRRRIGGLPLELWQNRTLILNLAKNDFKTKYAGSYLGIFWAFVQPIVTVLVYWFVFQVGLRSGEMNNIPFVLWLVAGLVPWFFFQDTLNGGTNALIEYSYLVKKVVFKISILPIVKAISALFVHLFFVAFTLILYTCYGYFPDLYVLQVVYYTFALFIFTLGICYATCAIVVFFRDLTQIINIVLQVGVWMTPIMWNIDVMGAGMPRILVLILKANPLYYIINGYRDALINKIWVWERFGLTMYFWALTAVLFLLGAVIFKRLKVHFADIL